MLTVWLRNAMLVQLVVILAIAAVLLTPRLLMPAFVGWYDSGNWRWAPVALYADGRPCDTTVFYKAI
jgi:hypothetical protein